MQPNHPRPPPAPDDGVDGDLGMSFATDEMFRDPPPTNVKRNGVKGETTTQGRADGRQSMSGSLLPQNLAQLELESLLNGSPTDTDERHVTVPSNSSRFMDDLAQRRASGPNGLFGMASRSRNSLNADINPSHSPSRDYARAASSNPNSPSPASSASFSSHERLMQGSSNTARARTLPRGRLSSVRAGDRTGDKPGGVISAREASEETPGRSEMTHLIDGSMMPIAEYQESNSTAQRPGHSPPPKLTPNCPIGPSPPPKFLPPHLTIPLSRYITDVLICNFHLDLGPIVERRLAGRAWSNKGEKANIAFSSFPDGGVAGEGGVGFGFKVRQGAGIGGDSIGSDENAQGRRSDSIDPQREKTKEEDAVTPRAKSKLRKDESYFGLAHIPTEPEPLNGSSAHRHDLPGSSQSSPPSSPPPITTPRLIHSPSFFGPPPEPPTPLHLQPPPPSQTERTAEYTQWTTSGRAWIYGFVFFRQSKDPTSPRGYMQRSLVILTHLPWPGLFGRVVEVLAGRYFEMGYAALEAACKEMSKWPDPLPGAVLRLPLGGQVLNVRLPDASETSLIPRGSTNGHHLPPSLEILPTLPRTTPLRTFSSLLPSLWHLWECMMLSEPILVFASDPTACSEAVWWLRDLLRPIPATMYDFRPYFHIHDADFRLLIDGSAQPCAGLVLGVTNPVFRTAAAHWPNLVTLGESRLAKPKGSVSSSGTTGSAFEAEGFASKRKRHVSKDRDMLRRLERLAATEQYDDPSGNEALRTHFMQMTEKMLAPVNRYIASLIPVPGSLEGMRPFSLSAFLSHLKANAPNPLQFRTKGLSGKAKSESDFYTAFCTGAGFAGWLQDKVNDLNESRASAGLALLDPPRLVLQGQTPRSQVSGTSLDYPRSSTDTEKSTDGSGRSSTSSRPSPADGHLSGRRASEGVGLVMGSMRLS